LLFGRLTDGGRLTVDLDDKDESKTDVLLDIQPLPKKEGKSKPEAREATAG
jgi:ATP-dependent Clp protease ATP-binding subunit ClpA